MPNARPGAFVTGASANSAREELSSGAAPSLFEMAEVAQTAEGGRAGVFFCVDETAAIQAEIARNSRSPPQACALGSAHVRRRGRWHRRLR